MTTNVLSRIFTIEIGDTPTLAFEAQNQREAQLLWSYVPPVRLPAPFLDSTSE
jgi:hypothetical protein